MPLGAACVQSALLCKKKFNSSSIKGYLIPLPPHIPIHVPTIGIVLQEKLPNFKFTASIIIKISSRGSYRAWPKPKVVLFAKENGNRAVEWQFNGDEKCIRL